MYMVTLLKDPKHVNKYHDFITLFVTTKQEEIKIKKK